MFHVHVEEIIFSAFRVFFINELNNDLYQSFIHLSSFLHFVTSTDSSNGIPNGYKYVHIFIYFKVL